MGLTLARYLAVSYSPRHVQNFPRYWLQTPTSENSGHGPINPVPHILLWMGLLIFSLIWMAYKVASRWLFPIKLDGKRKGATKIPILLFGFAFGIYLELINSYVTGLFNSEVDAGKPFTTDGQLLTKLSKGEYTAAYQSLLYHSYYGSYMKNVKSLFILYFW